MAISAESYVKEPYLINCQSSKTASVLIRGWLAGCLAIFAVSCGSDPTALGSRIYLTGQAETGPLNYELGPDWFGLTKLGCQACHGPAGHGQVVRAGAVTGAAPPLTRNALARRGYDEATLRRAIIEGLDVTGRPMSYYMPRWKLSERELQALLGYLAAL